jgi:hypothetical protein
VCHRVVVFSGPPCRSNDLVALQLLLLLRLLLLLLAAGYRFGSVEEDREEARGWSITNNSSATDETRRREGKGRGGGALQGGESDDRTYRSTNSFCQSLNPALTGFFCKLLCHTFFFSNFNDSVPHILVLKIVKFSFC